MTKLQLNVKKKFTPLNIKLTTFYKITIDLSNLVIFMVIKTSK